MTDKKIIGIIAAVAVIAVVAVICVAFMPAFTSPSSAQTTNISKTQVVTDQLGRNVTIPDPCTRVVCLEHHALDIILELGGKDQLVGLLQTWKTSLPTAEELYPELDNLSMPGDLQTVNIEELLALHPDVVVVTHYAPQEMIDQIESAGIPVVALSYFDADYAQASKLNPTLTDPDMAYTVGMRDAITILGEVLGKEDRAQQLINVTYQHRDLVKERTANISEENRTTCYLANPDLYTYGTGKYVGSMLERAGGINVAANTSGYGQVSMEQVLAWNPDVIFVQGRYAQVADEIMNDSAWQQITAVKEHRVYTTPEYVKPWGHPCPESMALGELWMAKKLYPDRFTDIDVDAMANEFYENFYGVPYTSS